MELLAVRVGCDCFPRGGKAYPPLRISSTAAKRIQESAHIAKDTVIGTWKCRHCGTTHHLKAGDLHLGSS